MSKIKYITTPEQTPDSRNEKFYTSVSHDWQKRARQLQDRRWGKISQDREL